MDDSFHNAQNGGNILISCGAIGIYVRQVSGTGDEPIIPSDLCEQPCMLVN